MNYCQLLVRKSLLACITAVLLVLPGDANARLRPGTITVEGSPRRIKAKEGRRKVTFYLLKSERPLKVKIAGPANVVLLVRSMAKGRRKASITLTRAGLRATETITVFSRASRGLYIKVPKGVHLLEISSKTTLLVRPVRVRRKPVAGEKLVEFSKVEPPKAVATVKPKEPSKAELPPIPPPPPVEETKPATAQKPLAPEPKAAVGKKQIPPPPQHKQQPGRKAKPQETAAVQEHGKPPTAEEIELVPHKPSEQGPKRKVTKKVENVRRKPPQPQVDPSGIGEFGTRGIWRSWTARAYKKHSITIGTSLEYFESSGFLTGGDRNKRFRGRLVIAGSPLQGLEVGAAVQLVQNLNDSFNPSESDALGDPSLFVRYGYQLLDWLAMGLGIQSVFPSGQKFSQISTDGISTKIIAAFDFTPLPQSLITLNVGYHFDNSKRIFSEPLNDAQRFAAGIYPHDQLLINFGFSWQLWRLAPFLEYGTALAMGADNMDAASSPHWLTLGTRWWPLGFHTLQVMAAVDIGLTATGPGTDVVVHNPPYNIVLSVGYDFGGAPPPEVIEREVLQTVEIEKPCIRRGARVAATGSRIVGRIVDASTQRPVGGARIVMEADEPAIFLSEPEQGRFYTCPMSPGPVRLRIYRDGYAEQSQVVLVSDRPETPITVRLIPTGKQVPGTLKGTVRSITGLPLPALITIPARKVSFRASEKDGTFSYKLRGGKFDVLISMPGYVTQRRSVQLEAGEVVILNVELYPKK